MHQLSRHQLIVNHLPFSTAVADVCYKEFELRGVLPFSDVLGYAHQGLCEAADRYCPSTGNNFSTFSWFRIRGAVVDGVRKCTRSRAAHVYAKKAKESEGDPSAKTEPAPPAPGLVSQSDQALDELPSTDHLPADDALDARRLQIAIRKAIAKLPELERKVTLLHFYQGDNLTEASEKLGIHKSYASKLHFRALKLLAQALAVDGADHSEREPAR